MCEVLLVVAEVVVVALILFEFEIMEVHGIIVAEVIVVVVALVSSCNMFSELSFVSCDSLLTNEYWTNDLAGMSMCSLPCDGFLLDAGLINLTSPHTKLSSSIF